MLCATVKLMNIQILISKKIWPWKYELKNPFPIWTVAPLFLFVWTKNRSKASIIFFLEKIWQIFILDNLRLHLFFSTREIIFRIIFPSISFKNVFIRACKKTMIDWAIKILLVQSLIHEFACKSTFYDLIKLYHEIV